MAKKRKQATKRQARAKAETPELLTWALHGIQQAIEATQAKLADLEAQARKLRGAGRAALAAAAESMASGTGEIAPVPKPAARARKKRTLSADARRRIAEAQKRRWAKTRAGKSTPA